ncbi:MAG TPA: Cys-tRNA(Pro) deacylase [Acidimicrobiia bacterium]|nr:Cys-tRNA(Pro) deacylase [Acidimicrobiia bacterium]
MGKMTRGVQILQSRGVAYTLHPYRVVDEGESYGAAVAGALGVPLERLFKTLLAAVDSKPVVAIVPVSGRLGMKELARAAGGKRAEMIAPAEAERLTGYVTGGISPFGQKKRVPVYADESILTHPTVYCSAGQRGLQVELSPADLISVLDATTARLSGE